MLDLGLEERMTAKVGLLSGGQRQALTLLMATLQKPKVLLLDEHTAALDPKTAAKVLATTDRIVNKDHLTTLMITHNMKDAIAHGNRLVMMNEGQIVLDIRGEEKKHLTVEDLLHQFEKVSGQEFASDKALLGEFPKRRTAHIRGLCAFSASGCTPAGKLVLPHSVICG